MVIRRIGVASAAKIGGLLYVVIGLVMGAIFAAISLVGAGIAAQDPDVPAWFGAFFGVGALIIAPIFYGILGAVGGALMAAVYNLAAGAIGGLEIDVS